MVYTLDELRAKILGLNRKGKCDGIDLFNVVIYEHFKRLLEKKTRERRLSSLHKEEEEEEDIAMTIMASRFHAYIIT